MKVPASVICVIGIVLLFGSVGSVKSEIPSEIIIQKANEGLEYYLNNISSSELVNVGIPVDLPRNEIALAPPLKMYVYQQDDDGIRLRENNIWYFPITDGDRYLSIITVDFFEGSWKAVGIGKANLSSEIKENIDVFSISSSHELGILVDYLTKSNFLIIQKAEKSEYLPLNTAKTLMGTQDDMEYKSFKLKELQHNLR